MDDCSRLPPARMGFSASNCAASPAPGANGPCATYRTSSVSMQNIAGRADRTGAGQPAAGNCPCCCSRSRPLSDAADGFLAKRFGWQSELGGVLDPIADKVLLGHGVRHLESYATGAAVADGGGGCARRHHRAGRRGLSHLHRAADGASLVHQQDSTRCVRQASYLAVVEPRKILAAARMGRSLWLGALVFATVDRQRHRLCPGVWPARGGGMKQLALGVRLRAERGIMKASRRAGTRKC